jgi:hypothetical protein
MAENERLKQQLVRAENWEAEAAKYKLIQLITDSFVYAPNDDQLNTQPYHWLCAHCFQNKQKSLLQRGEKKMRGWIYTCPACKNSILGPVGLSRPTQDALPVANQLPSPRDGCLEDARAASDATESDGARMESPTSA